MTIFLKRLAIGLAAAQGGRRTVERAVRDEWRAIRMAQQDRAHLATLAHPPTTHAPSVEPPSAAPSSLQPPARD